MSPSKPRRLAACLVPVLAGLLVGCAGQSGGNPPVDPSTLRIEPTGGTYRLANGSVALTVPAGAVTHETDVVVREIAPAVPAPHGAVFGETRAIGLYPADLTFAHDVTLTLQYNPALLPTGGSVASAGIYLPAVDRWQLASGSGPGTTAGTVRAPIGRLGVFATLIRLDTGLAGAPAYIPDPALVTALRAALVKPAGDITIGELAARTGLLDIENYPITDLTGLEHCTAIDNLVVWNDELTDLRPIARLTQLTRLSVGKNHIVDVSPLSGLTGLHELLLAHNNVVDFSPIAGLPITTMSLSDNPITDFSPLSRMPTLSTFFMAHSNLTTLPFVPYIAQVHDLWLQDNHLSDLTPLATLTNLDGVHLSQNAITDLQPLVNNTGLGVGDVVDLDNNPLNLAPGSAASLQVAALRARGVTVNLVAAAAAQMPGSQ